MENVNLMDKKEKIFFAGCLKSLLLANGKIESEEIENLNKMTDELIFDSFPQYLESFEERVKTIETFWEMAEQITNNEVQNLILSSLHEFKLKDHIPGYNEGKLLEELQYIWS